MNYKELHITLLLTLIWSFSFAQQYTNYSTKDGLPSNHVYTILQDTKGFMWFLTDKGMVKYNGKTFKIFTTKDGLPNNDVWDAFTAPDGKIWYLSKSTHLGYIKNDSVLSFPNQNKNEIINPIFSTQINNDIYPAGPNKTYKLKDNAWQEIKVETQNAGYYTKVIHNKVAFLGDDFRTNSLFAYSNSKTKLKRFNRKNQIYRTGARGQVNDSLYFLADNSGYTILNLNSLVIKDFNFEDEINLSSVKYPRINLVGNTLQITGDRFVGVLDANFHIVKPFYFPPHLKAHFGFIDKQNTIWLSTFTKGVYKLPKIKQDIIYDFEDQKIQKLNGFKNQLFASVYNEGFYKYNKEEKKFKPYIASKDFIFGVSNIETLDKRYFFSRANLFVEQQGKINTINFDKSLLNFKNLGTYLKNITLFNSELYGIHPFGIYRLDNKTLTLKKDILQKGCNDFLVFNSRLLVATTNGLKEIKNDAIYNIEFKNEIFNKSILSIKSISKTEVLINTDGFGSFISDLNTISPLKGSEFLIVQDAFIKDKSIWLATNSGVLHFEKAKSNYKLGRNYTINDGLPNNNVNTVFVDNEDLFVGTNSGLAILPINQTKQEALIDVYIEKANYNNENITTNNSTFKYQENNNLNFTISNIDYSENHSKFSYDYKLEPIQKEWTDSKFNSFNYNDLQPGKYTFYVTSNNIQKTLDFTIKPLWWQKLWIKLISVLLGILLIAYVSWLLIKRSQFKKNQKTFEDKRLSELQLKALRSQMNPHFVFNSLSAIQYYIGENNFEASELYLVKFSKLIRQFFELSKENEISLATEVSLLNNYLEIEKLRFKEKLNFSIHVDPNLNMESTKIPTMLLQPIVENAVNHGVFNKLDNGLVTLNFIQIDAQTFKVEIMDDGVGFANTKKRQRKNVKSSNVLIDRLHFLNYSEKWKITYNEAEVHPDKTDKGNKSIFLIKKNK